MDTGEFLGNQLQTIRNLMNSRFYDQSESQSIGDINIEEEQEFLDYLIEQLVDLQTKLRQEKIERSNQFEIKREKQNDLIFMFHQEAEILEQKNQELIKVLQNQEEQHIDMSSSLAKQQLEHFQSSQVLQELENEFNEGNKYKIKTEEVNLQNKLLKEKKLQLVSEENFYKSQIEDQNSQVKKLTKDYLHAEKQYKMYEVRLNQMKKEQEEQIKLNQKQKDLNQQMNEQCKQLNQQNQTLLDQKNLIQYQIEEVVSDQNINMSLHNMQSNYLPVQNEENYFGRNQLKNMSSQDQNFTSLKDELGDQFSDTFLSPLSSITETEREEQKQNRLKTMNSVPFKTEQQKNQNQYDTSGGTTEQSSTNTRLSDAPQPSLKAFTYENPIKHLNKVMIDYDLNSFNETEKQNETKDNSLPTSSKNLYSSNYSLNGGFYKYNRDQEYEQESSPKRLNNVEIKEICNNIIDWLTYKPLIAFNSNHQIP